jgi:transposase
MPRQQRTYAKEFKEEAIRLVQTSGKSMSQVARDLGISDSVLSHWCQQAKKHGTEAFPGSGHQTAQEEEIRRLKRELALAQQECAILKKTVGIFSRGNQP